MTEEELQQLIPVFVAKAKALDWIEDPDERLRAQVMQVIVDTDLTVSGAVPVETWLAAT